MPHDRRSNRKVPERRVSSLSEAVGVLFLLAACLGAVLALALK